MEEKEYRDYLKKIRKKSSEEIDEYVILVQEYETFIKNTFKKAIDNAKIDEMLEFFKKIDEDSKDSALKYLRSTWNYYRCTFNQLLSDELEKIICEKIGQKRFIFAIKKFHGINKDHTKKLSSLGIDNIEQMIEAGKNPDKRKELAIKTDIPLDSITELTKLSNIARIAGLKGTRARLYFDAGLDTLEKIAAQDPVELRKHLIKFCEDEKYTISKPPTQKECNNHVKIAKQFPKIIEH